MESREGQRIRLGSLDLLRGFAILGVVAFHSAISFPIAVFRGGAGAAATNLGVQLFFLVSAYTMCFMWRTRAGEPQPALSFYIRRLCRIAPLYWAMILVYGLARGWPPPSAIAANALLVHSVVPGAINTVVPGGWSIGVEIAFYLAFPLIAGLGARALGILAFAWFCLAGVGVEQFLATRHVPELFLYYCPLTQFPVFLIGMMMFRRINDGGAIAGDALLAAIWIGLALAFRHAGLPGRPMFWLGVFGLAVGARLLIRFGVSLRPVDFLGRLSYSMYLLHFAVIGALLSFGFSWNGWAALPVVLALTAAVAWISFRTAERWSQKAGRELVGRLRPGR